MKKLTEKEFSELIDLVDHFNSRMHSILWNRELPLNEMSDLKGLSISIEKTIDYLKSDRTPDVPDRKQLSLF